MTITNNTFFYNYILYLNLNNDYLLGTMLIMVHINKS